MPDFVQTYSGVIVFGAFFLLMLRVRAGHRGHAGYEHERASEPVPVEAESDHAATARRARHHGGGRH